jgi:ABC-2 type transport system permease protein
LGVFVYAAPAIVISGYASPVENMPLALQWLSVVDPIRYMLVITRGMFLENLPLGVVLQQSWPMALIGFGLLAVAGLFVRRAL